MCDIDSEISIVSDSEGLWLSGYGMRYRGDFTQMLSRISNGRLHHEMLIRMVKTDKQEPVAIDATAGMGEDAFLLAAYGYRVICFEKNHTVATLLKDAVFRARNHPDLSEIANRMDITEGDAVELMPQCMIQPDIIYLDPMFPPRKKSGLVGKKLQLIQMLEQPCIDEHLLLEAAVGMRPGKIIIKRPLKGATLAGRNPSYSIKGKTIRYDCIVV